MPWRLYFSHLLAYCIVSILNSILWTLYCVVYDSKVIAHGSIWGEVPCIPDHPVHVGSTPSNLSIHIYPRITIKINILYSHSWRNPYVLLSGMYVLIVCGAQSGRGPERMGQDQMIRTCRDFLSEYITIVALVILCLIPHVCITPCWAPWRVGNASNESTSNNMENSITHLNQNSGKRSRKEMDPDSESDIEIYGQ